MTNVVKAEIKTKDGTYMVIDGTEEEVRRLLSLIQDQNSTKTKKAKDSKEDKTGNLSIGDMLLELKYEGFFDKPKNLIEVKNALAEKGRIYAITTLSSQVLRAVKKRTLGRIKQNKRWVYVKR